VAPKILSHVQKYRTCCVRHMKIVLSSVAANSWQIISTK
jgi:hypothetical protein